ncbi:MAG: P1 family peptidase [Parvibaculaceae bacterium]
MTAMPQPLPDTGLKGEALKLDFPGLRIGVAEYAEGPTGTTVFHFPGRVKAAVDVRGGFPGTFNVDILRFGYDTKIMDAFVISGGSIYGLAAAGGVVAALKEDGHRSGDIGNVGFASGAIIFDLGDRRVNELCPDAALGAAALRAAREGVFPLGAHGAGRMTKQGLYFGLDLHSGQGGAFRQVGKTKIAAFAVANPVGVIVDRQGRVAAGGQKLPQGISTIADLLAGVPYPRNAAGFMKQGHWTEAAIPPSNTTISLVVTNRKLPFAAVQRLGYQVHSSMGRAIQPFATGWDGDVLFAATTDEVDDPDFPEAEIATLASEVMWDALLSVNAQRNAVPLDHAGLPMLDDVDGDYVFDRSFSLRIRRTKAGLSFDVTGKRGFFGLPQGATLHATIESNGRFLVDGPALRPFRDGAFMAEGKRISRVVVNLGHWQQTGHRQ